MRGDQEGCPRNTKWGLFLPGIPRSRPPARSFSLGPVLLVVSLPFVPSCVLVGFPTGHLHYRTHIRSCTTVKPRSSGDCRTEAEICPYFGRAASLYLRWHNGPIFHPRRGSRADVSSPATRRYHRYCSCGDTFRNAHNLSSLSLRLKFAKGIRHGWRGRKTAVIPRNQFGRSSCKLCPSMLDFRYLCMWYISSSRVFLSYKSTGCESTNK